MAGWYLFCLGFAAGLTFLALNAYLTVSPRWLRWLLLLSGLLVISRYVTMAWLATVEIPPRFPLLYRCWFATSIGLTFPTLVALDQLVRHPAITPKRVVRWYLPFLAAYVAALLFGRIEVIYDPLMGVSPRLLGLGRGLLVFTNTVFAASVLGLCGLLLPRLKTPPIQRALLVLMAAYLFLIVDGVIVLFGGWYVRPFLFSEMLTLLALWMALQTARAHST